MVTGVAIVVACDNDDDVDDECVAGDNAINDGMELLLSSSLFDVVAASVFCVDDPPPDNSERDDDDDDG
jgi:hypothetical protein